MHPAFPSFSYTSWQRLGLALLLLLLLLAAQIPSSPDPAVVAYAAAAPFPEPAETPGRPPAESFSFNPNTISSTDLRRLGLSEAQAASWIRFRGDRARAFREPEDIRKLFVLTDAQKDRLVPLANLPARQVGAGARVPGRRKEQRKVKPGPLRLLTSFPFNPNTLPQDSFELLGFPDYQARAIVKYRGDRPRTFRHPEDLFKLRSLDSGLVAAVRDLQYFAPPPENSAPAPAPKKIGLLDINLADTTALKTLPGIGSYRARRLIGFRDALGGFSGLSQVAETYGLPDSTFQRIRPYLLVGGVFRQLRINELDAPALARHPYIDRKLAGAIVRYREKHGPFGGAEELSDLRTLRPEQLARLRPYLRFD